jgi:hypothetical protein
MSSAFPRLVLKYLCFFLYLAFLTLVVEGLTRYLVPKHPRIADELLNHRWRPNYVFTERGCTRRINGQSWLEDYDISKPKPSNTIRIFYLGDSFTAGECGSSVPDQVEIKLRAELQDAKREIEVINAGTPSYSPVLYYLQFKHEILPYQPDLIVINVDMTDNFDDYLCLLIGKRDSNGEIIAVPRGSTISQQFRRTKAGLKRKNRLAIIADTLGEYSYFVSHSLRLYYEHKERLFAKNDRPVNASIRKDKADGPENLDPYAWCDEHWSPNTITSVEHTLAYLEKLILLAKKAGISVVITAVPHLEQFLGTWSKEPLRAIEELCLKHKIAYLDSYSGLDNLLQGRDPKSLYLPNDMHFSPLGYQYWAEVHRNFLLKELGRPLFNLQFSSSPSAHYE